MRRKLKAGRVGKEADIFLHSKVMLYHLTYQTKGPADADNIHKPESYHIRTEILLGLRPKKHYLTIPHHPTSIIERKVA